MDLNEIEILLNNQIMYYFSNSNIIKDTYLRNLIKSDKKQYILINNLLCFNMVRTLFNKFNIYNKNEKINILIKILDKNEKFTLDKFKTKFKLKTKLKYEELANLNDIINNKTIYVENISSKFNDFDIQNIFKDCGEIIYIKLNKYKNGLNKGYCFIEFKDKIGFNKALKMNNTIPNLFLENNLLEVNPLKIITKNNWLEYKKIFKNYLNSIKITEQTKNKLNIKNNRLLELYFDLDKDFEVDLGYLEVTTLQFNNNPDKIYFNRNIGKAVLRFKNLTNLKLFQLEFNDKQNTFFSYKIKTYILDKKETIDYFNK